MTKPTSLLRAFVLGLLLLPFAASASEGEGMESAGIDLGDKASLQHGAGLYMSYCSGCHALSYQRYSRVAEDLNLSNELVEQNLIPNGQKIGETIDTGMDPADGLAFFGKAPPDLSVEARAKAQGADWIYNYLKSFYIDPSRPAGWNNTVFPNASMPNALWELQGLQVAVKHPAEEGHEAGVEKLELKTPGRLDAAQYDQAVRDITAFLQYAGEPAALQRESIGVWVLLYLALFTFITWLLKHEYWKDVH